MSCFGFTFAIYKLLYCISKTEFYIQFQKQHINIYKKVWLFAFALMIAWKPQDTIYGSQSGPCTPIHEIVTFSAPRQFLELLHHFISHMLISTSSIYYLATLRCSIILHENTMLILSNYNKRQLSGRRSL